MALFILYGSNSSFSARFYILALIALVLVCFCSNCSSSSIASPVIDVDPLSDDIDEIGNDDGNTYLIPLKSPTYHYINGLEQQILSSNNRFLHRLLRPALNQPDYRHNKQHNKRYASQSFHAMRG